MSTEQNKSNIQANRKKIFEVENAVLYNRGQAYVTRSLVLENAALIRKNYDAAFSGNRQLANQNTDDLFRNRTALVRNLDATTPVATNFKEAMTNKVKLEYLEHRSKLNEKVLKTSEDLASVNKQLIEINRHIMDTNEDIVAFNSQMISDNTTLLKSGLGAAHATPSSNGQIVSANSKKIEEIASRSKENKLKIAKLLEETQKNRAAILANSEQIADRRARIQENHSKIANNQDLVANFISKL